MPGVLNLSVHLDVRDLTRNLTRLAEKQIPFATAQGLNALGAIVKDAERANLKKTFPTATPFTLNSLVVIKARKTNPTVTVLVKDIAAKYLTPFEDGGVHVLNSRALLNPKNINLNQYGNLPKNKLAALRGRNDVFIGAVKSKAGNINGVWQRIPARKGEPAKLKLLIRFGDALPVKERLNYRSKAAQVVSVNFAACFNAAMAKAMASAK